jgi:hypothetical protein
MTAARDFTRFNAVTQVDPNALIRALQHISGRSILPRRVNTERLTVRGTTSEVLHIEIEVATAEVSLDAVRLITARVKQLPIALSASFTYT